MSASSIPWPAQIPSAAANVHPALAERWEGQAWPSARAHSHILSALPAGSFPGVDDADIYEFLDQHARAERD